MARLTLAEMKKAIWASRLDIDLIDGVHRDILNARKNIEAAKTWDALLDAVDVGLLRSLWWARVLNRCRALDEGDVWPLSKGQG